MRVYVRSDRLARLALLALVVCLAAPVRRANAQPPVPATPNPVQQEPPPQPLTIEQPEGPFREVFARRQRREGTQSMTFSLSGYGGYDSNVIGDTNGVGFDPSVQAGGSGLVGADAGLQYAKTGHRASFAGNLDGSYRYFPSRRSLSTSSVDAGVGLVYQLAHRTSVRLQESFAYEPYYQLGFFPSLGEPDLGAPIPSNLDFAVVKRQSVISTTSASIEQQLSRRSTLTFDAQYFSQTLGHIPTIRQPATQGTAGQPGAQDTTGQAAAQNDDARGYGGGLHFSRLLSRYMTFRLGYEYLQFTYPEPTRRILKSNSIDAGVDYSRSLAFSRHTSLSFSTGTSIVSYDNRRFGEITGTASLVHLFTRNWQGALSYNRDMNFVQTLSRPLFADTASAELQGIINKRWLMSITGGYLSGRLGLSRSDSENSTVRTGTGAFSLAYALTDYLRATFDYSYYTYRFSNDLVLPTTGLPPSFDRNSVRGGLQLVLPLIH